MHYRCKCSEENKAEIGVHGATHQKKIKHRRVRQEKYDRKVNKAGITKNTIYIDEELPAVSTAPREYFGILESVWANFDPRED